MAKNIVETSFEGLDRSIIERAKYRIIDTVGCALAGVRAPGCSMVLDLLREWGGKHESTVLGFGGRLPVHNAALINSVMARSYDFEPTGDIVGGKNIPTHISGTTVPVAMAVGEQTGASGRDLLTALVAGEDLTARVAAASLLNVDSGWDPSGTVNVLGAAAVAGKLWCLDGWQMLNALGITVNQMAGTFQNIFDYAHTFKLPQGLAAQSGIFAAALAKKGFLGTKDPLTAKHGYFSLYCDSYNLDALTDQLGMEYCSGDTFKPYPGSRSNHAAVECTLEVVRSHPIAVEDIDEIIVSVTGTAGNLVISQPFRIGETPQVNAAFSLQYTVACALLRGSVCLDHFTDDFVADPKIREVAEKIRLAPTFPSHKPLGASVKIKTRHGKEYEATVNVPKGSDTFTPLSEDEKKQKFLDNCAFSKAISKARAEKALAMMAKLEEIDDVRRVAKLLAA
jgi:2-methylcitrate dehydratase PrpD